MFNQLLYNLIKLLFRQPRRSPYHDYEYEHDRFRLDSLNLPIRSPTPPISTANCSDCGAFESVSLLSLSDQTTLDSSANSPSNKRRTVVPSTSLTVIERNARIIKWLFQLNKANASPSFQEVQ
jgi:centrosome-associated FAM110-like protein